MDFIVELLNNQVFVSAALGWLVAQVLKTRDRLRISDGRRDKIWWRKL